MPRIRLNPEDGFKSPDADLEDASQVSTTAPPLRSATAAAKQRILDTIAGALSGTLPKPETREGSFVLERLNETHIQMVLERALTNQTYEELGARYGLHPMYIGVICRHPYAQQLIAQVTGAMADSVDDVQERIAATAAEALAIKIELMRTSQLDTVRDRIATDLLDRAGYGARRQVDISKTVNETRTVRVEAQQSSHLARVLAESLCVAAVDYTQHLAARPSVSRDEEGSATGDFGIAPRNAGLLPRDGLLSAAEDRGVSHATEGPSVPTQADDEEAAA